MSGSGVPVGGYASTAPASTQLATAFALARVSATRYPPDLDDSDLRLLMWAIASHVGEDGTTATPNGADLPVAPGPARLAALTGLSARVVRRFLGRLIQHGYLVRLRGCLGLGPRCAPQQAVAGPTGYPVLWLGGAASEADADGADADGRRIEGNAVGLALALYSIGWTWEQEVGPPTAKFILFLHSLPLFAFVSNDLGDPRNGVIDVLRAGGRVHLPGIIERGPEGGR